ncbi:MAG: ATP-binding protein [Spartobacteria bacterium]|nr:ATP-binding protein [Spartobacteria bacterium]
MKYKERLVSDRLLSLIGYFPVVVVAGARQVGKSTLLKHLLPDWDMVVFDPVVDIGNARADPELFLQNHPVPLILDEIQYAPEVVPCIKRLVDANKRPGMIVLTGSQQWSVMKSISESLAGRAVFLDLEGFALCESAEVIPATCWLEHYLENPEQFINDRHPLLETGRTCYETLWRGSLPEMDTMPLDMVPEFFSAYMRTYIERDARLLLNVDDWQPFGRFVQLMATLTAHEINYSQLGREIGITPQTAKRWLTILAGTFQWFDIPAWHGNSIKRISSKPKGVVADTGFACHLLHITTPKTLDAHPMTGFLFESFMIAEIRKLQTAMTRKTALYHWRAHSGGEVDMLLERDGIFYPLEIKLKSRPSRHDIRGFQALREQYPHRKFAPGLILACAEQCEKITDHAFVVPWNIY